MVNGWKILKYILICLHWMKLTWVIQLSKNVFAINICIKILTFHGQNLTKGCGRGLHRPEPDVRPVPGPARPGPRFFQLAGPGRQMKGCFSNGPGRPANEGWCFQRAGPPKRQMSFLTTRTSYEKRKAIYIMSQSGPIKQRCSFQIGG